MQVSSDDDESTIKAGRPNLLESEAYRLWKSWSSNSFGSVSEVEKTTFKAELELAGICLDKKLRILEIGFGNGAFASWAILQGWTFTGTEIDQELVARARAKGWDAYHAEMALTDIAAGKVFDLVVAFDVLEHLTLSKIAELLVEIKGLLASGGKFIARFPSGDSPFSRAMQHGDLTHKSIIGSGIVTQLALKTGFRIVQVRGPAFPIFGLGAKRAVRRLGVFGLRSLIKRIVNVAFHDNQRRVVDPNMVIVLESENARSTLEIPPNEA